MVHDSLPLSPGGPCPVASSDSWYTRLPLVVRGSCFPWFSAPRVVQLFLWSGSGGGPVHRGRGRKAQLCRLCGVDLRVRMRSAGEGSPATREARKPGASTLAVVGVGRHDSATTKGGAGNMHGLVGPFGQPRPML